MIKYTKCLCLCLIFCCVALESSNYQEIITKEDEPWVRALIQNNFSLTPFVNVILGTKPMATTLIDKVPHPEDLTEIENDPDRSEASRAVCIRLMKLQGIDNEWKKWMVLKTKLPIQNFLFRTDACLNGDYYEGSIINVREVLWMLETHYSIFSRQLDMQFDPLKMTLEFENPDSEFWKKVLDNHYLEGILYGFGERNAYFFSLAHNNKHWVYDNGIFLCPKMRSEIPARVDVPAFRSFYTPFGEMDPIVEKHAKEAEKINALLNNNDPYELILKQLTQ